MAKGFKRVVVLPVIATVVIAGLVVGFIALDSYLDPFDDRPFNPEAWAAADQQDRGSMARDAMQHLPLGMPAVRVRELFGEPEIIPRGGDRWGMSPRDGETWSYWLGCWSALGWYGFDTAFLYIHFDREGRVIAAEITGG
jgi:hypothetical protein